MPNDPKEADKKQISQFLLALEMERLSKYLQNIIIFNLNLAVLYNQAIQDKEEMGKLLESMGKIVEDLQTA